MSSKFWWFSLCAAAMLLTGFVSVTHTFGENINISRCPGLLPVNKDGFEGGDRENFAPVYIGSSSEWVRPDFSVSKSNPIAGKYSLLMTGDGAEQKWVLASNAFEVKKPFRISLLFRQVKEGAEFALLGAVEKYSKTNKSKFAIADALRIGGEDVHFELQGDVAGWDDCSGDTAEGVIEQGTVYKLVMDYSSGGKVDARVIREDNQRIVATFAGISKTQVNGTGMYFYSPAGTKGSVQVDDVKIEYDGYELKENTWARSPQFVVFRRKPDVDEDQGEWVGAASAMYDEQEDIYKLWYRIRVGKVRGLGYGYATSKDGINWKRYSGSPVLTYDKERYASSEKISVLKVNGEYKGWFAVDTYGSWGIIYATSSDGIKWTTHGEVLNDKFYKDADVVYVNGKYYMYLIAPTIDELSVMTSENGKDWKFEAKIPAPCHVHVGAYYDKENRRFVLFQDAVDQVPYMKAATSEDGIHFGDFEPVLYNSEVGLDDIGIGVNYPTFYSNSLGHITRDDSIVMLYQARHDYHNNRPNWGYAGDGKLVMAGKFSGVRVGVPSVYKPRDGLYYNCFPIHCPVADGFSLESDFRVKFLVKSWDTGNKVVGKWLTETNNASVSFNFTGLKSDTKYTLSSRNGRKSEFTTDSSGCGGISIRCNGSQYWVLSR